MRGFIEELRYRNVFRVAIAYVVAGWLIAQVADLAADAFNAPDWVMQMLIVLMLMITSLHTQIPLFFYPA